jgi:hypothetical protein
VNSRIVLIDGERRKMSGTQRFLGVVDLLGFSALVMGEDLSVSRSMVKSFQKITRSLALKLNDGRPHHGLDRDGRVRMRFFSDLALIYTEGDSHDDCLDILEISSKLFRIGCENGLLPRGAIAWGEMIIQANTVVAARSLKRIDSKANRSGQGSRFVIQC